MEKTPSEKHFDKIAGHYDYYKSKNSLLLHKFKKTSEQFSPAG